MPAETLTAEQLRSAFAAKGISEQELVALSGAHTVPPVCSHRARWLVVKQHSGQKTLMGNCHKCKLLCMLLEYLGTMT